MFFFQEVNFTVAGDVYTVFKRFMKCAIFWTEVFTICVKLTQSKVK